MFTFLTKLPTLVLFLAAFGVSLSAALPARSEPLEPTVNAYARRLELLKGPLAPKGSSRECAYKYLVQYAVANLLDKRNLSMDTGILIYSNPILMSFTQQPTLTKVASHSVNFLPKWCTFYDFPHRGMTSGSHLMISRNGLRYIGTLPFLHGLRRIVVGSFNAYSG
ncbi:uncharacterized protein EI90DRAFT_3082678 [Cantharellus anzutake]|uniref:uncharacterized protein n=1 Tax=Cantharellus anzutake TaxID=1750568 RepID=UPI001906E644|nr:uncharacterized protein EI90DRAFT_3082678 [Cantharellus anzutake]KAF8318920.1 hypothetical protein EI90DRAFT_3082678 [Cantharellus anzutake]